MKLARLGGMGWVLVASAVACLHAWGQMGGASSGAPQAAVLDAEHRPITAGGFVKSGPVVFEDIAARAGLTQWRHTMGTPEKTYILETMGSGVGLLDYDNDGWLDIYLVNGSTYDAIAGKTTPPHAALFHNNHDGTFTDVTSKAGVANDRWGFGVAIADYDNDGWPDIYVYGCCGEGGRRAGQLVGGRDVGRLRWRWQAGSVCAGLYTFRFK
jgi:hypothetical protein